MQYKIEVIYTYGWDDACWTEETTDGVTRPLRFQTVGSAQKELDEFFADVKDAVAAGDMDIEENPNHYRIVAVK
ncbi:MAG TPA: hypothetical protein VIK28_02935 [Sedimentisphaerales bacterium]